MSRMRVGTAACVLALALGACSSGGGAKKTGDGGVDGGGVPDQKFGVTVNDPQARACEVALTEGTREVAGVTFAAGVKGQWSRWAPRVAIAFTATADAALTEVATLTLRIKAAETQFPNETVTCYDRAGAKLAGSKVTIK